MYAIIRTGGKQYKVQAGDLVRVEKLEQELGSEFDLTEVLFVGGDKTYIGEPLLKNAKVTVVVTRQEKSPKVIIFKKKRRQGYRRLKGHRQLYTELFIKAITSPEGQTSKTDEAAPVVSLSERREERLAAQKAEKESRRTANKKAAAAGEAPVAKAKKKAPAKKAAAKKATAKKTVAKKKTTVKKKTAKKAKK